MKFSPTILILLSICFLCLISSFGPSLAADNGCEYGFGQLGTDPTPQCAECESYNCPYEENPDYWNLYIEDGYTEGGPYQCECQCIRVNFGPNCVDCAIESLDSNRNCEFCKVDRFDPTGDTPCTACLDSKYTFESECVDCSNILHSGPACDTCQSSPSLIFPDCNVCENPNFDSNTTPPCSDCLDNRFTFSSGCIDCANTNHIGGSCDVCKSSDTLTFPDCVVCTMNPKLDPDALPPCSSCSNAELSVESDCTECINELHSGELCNECNSSNSLIWPDCNTCSISSLDPNSYPPCSSCLDTAFSFESDCKECSNGSTNADCSPYTISAVPENSNALHLDWLFLDPNRFQNPALLYRFFFYPLSQSEIDNLISDSPDRFVGYSTFISWRENHEAYPYWPLSLKVKEGWIAGLEIDIYEITEQFGQFEVHFPQGSLDTDHQLQTGIIFATKSRPDQSEVDSIWTRFDDPAFDGYKIILEDPQQHSMVFTVDQTVLANITEEVQETVTTGCPLRCPPLMTPNIQSPDCSTCICVTSECKQLTFSTMLYFDENPDDSNAETINWATMEVLQAELTIYFQLNTIPNEILTSLLPPDIIYTNIEDLYETLTVHPIVVTQLDKAAKSWAWVLTITVRSFTQSPDPSIINNRRIEFGERLQNLIMQSPTPWASVSDLTHIFMDASKYNGIEVFFRDYHNGPIVKNTVQADTVCTLPSDPTKTSPCPLPSSTVSLLWDRSQCPEGNRYLLPQCLDLFGQASLPSPTICNSLYPNFPSVEALPCPTTNQVPVTLTENPIHPLYGLPIEVKEGDRLEVYWKYSGPEYYTITISLLKINPSLPTNPPYSTFLGIYLATSQATTIRIPYGITTQADTNTKFIFKVTVTQEPKHLLPLLPLPTSGNITILSVDPCNQTCGQHSKCNTTSFECECDIGYTMSDNGLCQLSCQGQCGEAAQGECVVALNDFQIAVGSKCLCPSGWTGESCQYPTTCVKKDRIECNGKGTTYNRESNSCNNDECICFQDDIWSGRQCDQCHLYQPESLIQCDPDGTDHTLTKKLCPSDRCVCNHGYMGEDCSLRAMYGVIYFTSQHLIEGVDIETNQTDQNAPSPTNSDKYHSRLNLEYITEPGQAAIERDLAFALGVDPSQVEMIALIPSDIRPEYFMNSNWNGKSRVDGNLYYNAVFAIALGKVIKSTGRSQFRALHSKLSSQRSSFLSTPSFSPQQNRVDIYGPYYTDLSSVYSNWSQLESNFPDSPLGWTESQQELGTFAGITNAYDPNCIGSTILVCPQGKDPFGIAPPGSLSGSRNVGMVVGIVVGVSVGVALFFIILICTTRRCKKNQQCCWKPNEFKAQSSKRSLKALAEPVQISMAATTEGSNSPRSSSRSSPKTSTSNLDLARKSSVPGTKSPNGSGTNTAITAGLTPISTDEDLPDGWTKQRHTVTLDEFYVYIKDGEMKSQRRSPLDSARDEGRSGW